MSTSGVEMGEYVNWWWALFATALFLLLPLDLFTTLLAVDRYGIAVEANPVMRWLLQRGLFAVTVANLAVTGIVVSLFHVAISRLQRVPQPYHSVVAPAVTAWIGFLLIAGLVLVANNLLVLV